MRKLSIVSVTAAVVFGLGNSIVTGVAQADFEPWDMMDPDWWFGDDDDDDWKYWYYGPGRYALGGPYGWGVPYGWGGYPGYYYGYPYAAAPQSRSAQQEVPPPPLPE